MEESEHQGVSGVREEDNRCVLGLETMALKKARACCFVGLREERKAGGVRRGRGDV